MSFELPTGLIAGLDEVGRGPLAGPVVAAAVILDPNQPIEGLADSKKLSEKKRERLAEEIKEKALTYALGRAEAHEIDEMNILQASLTAMVRAYEQLSVQADHILIDGNHCPKALLGKAQTVIKGDSLVPAISAASIIAKVTRDKEMIALDADFPEYGFASHKGYPTQSHMAAIEAHGVLAFHRRSFAPVRKIIEGARA